MSDVDVDDAQTAVDQQAVWPETLDGRAIKRLVAWAKRTEDRLMAARDAIVDLRQRVKALEDKTP